MDALRDEDKLTPDLVFKDPYFLDFLGLRGAYAEKDLEAAILREIEQFLLEMGAGFTFVERQKLQTQTYRSGGNRITSSSSGISISRVSIVEFVDPGFHPHPFPWTSND